jgi:hypothetical protein
MVAWSSATVLAAWLCLVFFFEGMLVFEGMLNYTSVLLDVL